ncbi:hypothetical protein EW146_g2311 [Bondarzewia mesenterica]|uniref:DNA mismatch repair protein n=1 Tax=Bondarzewia mesenterica TaxID=1095465 RepID=A0A4S4M116_9AGAM|nr:hypothetical protein EW146_g2311 [Bondarzewia mesenterica]
MAPKKPHDDMKQKSLTSFFSKAPANGNSEDKAKATSLKPATKAKPQASRSSSPPAESDYGNRTPASKRHGGRVVDATYTHSSDGGSSFKDTPPTSDPVDVDMEDEGESDNEPIPKVTRAKRKLIVEDSDEEGIHELGSAAYRKRLSVYRPSTRHEEVRSTDRAAKKTRISASLSGDEFLVEDNAEDEESVVSFSTQLSRFKKSPKKQGLLSSFVIFLGLNIILHAHHTEARKSKYEDDDFIVPSDEDLSDERPARSSSRSSGRSSRLSMITSDDDEDDDEPAAKLSKKSVEPQRPSLQKTSASKASGNSNSFLTAAEQREQSKQTEKKAQEDPFAFLTNPRDKDKVRPNEPGYDHRTLYIPNSAWNGFTPFEKQFWEIKQNHFDTVEYYSMFARVMNSSRLVRTDIVLSEGLYEEDARIGHREFDLKLTQRVKMSMVGVPESSFNFWAAKFLAKGYKVGRVDQAETALGAEMRVAASKGKGKSGAGTQKEKIVRRELNKVYTNGTLVDEDLLTDEQAGHCISVRELEPEDEQGNDQGSFGICVLDSATSEFNLSAFEDDVCRTRLETLMRQLRPKEILFTKGNLSVSTTRLLKSVLPASCLWTSLREVEGFGYKKTLDELKVLYPVDDGEMDDNDELGGVPDAIRSMVGCRSAIEALGAMMWYLRQLNIDKDILTMGNFNVYDPMKRGQGLVLDGQTLAHIEVLMNSEGTEEGSLLQLLGRCITPFGKRLFRIWMCMPLKEVTNINARLDAVETLMGDPQFEQDFAAVAKGLPDLERIVSRIHAKNCGVKDFINVLKAFAKLNVGLESLATTSEQFESKTILGLLRSAPNLTPNIIKIVELMYKKPDKDSDELLPAEGKDEAYDEIMEEIQNLEAKLENAMKNLETEVGSSLTYWHSATGTKDIYLVQAKVGTRHIPKDWVKSGGTKAVVRYIVPSLSQMIRSLKEARETRNATIKSFKYRLFAEFDKDRGVWLRAVRVLAELDCLVSLAKASNALGEPACRPEFIEGDAAWVDFEQLRHPALAAKTKSNFIPNDIRLGGSVGRLVLLTGPNMGGKSTVMRMTATGVIMAQLGMFVPARKARLCPVDSILTRMGAYDNMFSNASTFKVELDECCKILRDATPKSLVVLDELGRGTSTYDGMAIAGAVLHQLATHTLALSFFATHYGSLTDDFSYHPNIRNMYMRTLVDDNKRDLVFLYQLIEGVASGSFGTHVANLAGVPTEVVQRAQVVSTDFARQFKEKVEGKRRRSASAKLPLVAQADFAFLHGLVTNKYELDANPVRQREVLKGLKAAVLRALQEA